MKWITKERLICVLLPKMEKKGTLGKKRRPKGDPIRHSEGCVGGKPYFLVEKVFLRNTLMDINISTSVDFMGIYGIYCY